MKKTFKRIAIICSLLIFVTLNLTACKKECEHIYDHACDSICNECEQERETIEHNFSTSYETDETHHWYACQNEGCTVTNLKEEHIHEDDNDCTTEVLCTICNATLEEANTHNFSTSYETDETHHWYACQNDGCTVTNLKEEHIHEDDNDCTTEVLCTICNATLEEANTHNFSTSYETDETHHWYACQNDGCIIVKEKETHSQEEDDNDCTTEVLCTTCGKTLIEANETHTGGESTCIGQTCEHCGTLYGEINQNNHVDTETKIRYANETHHEIYYECCDTVIGTGEHDGAPTCSSYGYCSLCLSGYAYPNPNVHSSEEVYYIGTNGENHGAYYSCCQTLKEYLPHHATTRLANCLYRAQCDDCGSEFGELNKDVHYTNETRIELVDDTYHQEICIWCQTVLNTGEHTGIATCIERAYCDICKKFYGETDLNNHVSDEFTYINFGQTHQKRHTCCYTVAIEQEEHDRNLSSEDGIYDICSACDAKLFKIVTWVKSSTDKANNNKVILICTLNNLNGVLLGDVTITLKPGELIGDEEITINVSDGTIVDSGEKNNFGYREGYFGTEDTIDLVFDNPLADENHPTGSTVTIDFILTMFTMDGFKYEFTCSVTLEYIDI